MISKKEVTRIVNLFDMPSDENQKGVYYYSGDEESPSMVYICEDEKKEIEIPKVVKSVSSSIIIQNCVCVKVLFSGVSCNSLDLSKYDTMSLVNTENMFENCKIKKVDLSGLNLSNVTSMSGMFRNAQIGTLNLSNLDLSNVTNMYDMFSNAKIGTLDLTGVKLQNVKNMSCMFYGAKIDEIRGFEQLAIGSVTNVDSMLYNSATPILNSDFEKRLSDNEHFNNENISCILDKSEDDVKSYRFEKMQIRKNITEFANDNNSKHKKDFEELLMSFKDNIIESLFGVLFKTHDYNSNIKTVLLRSILVNEIVLSAELKMRFYDLYNSVDFVKDSDKKVENSDEDIKDIYEGFNNRILGEYYSKEKKIVLYIENMKEVIKVDEKSNRDLEDLFLSVLIHELFHAVHNKYCEEYAIPFGQQEHEIITESLAAAFEYYFCDKVLHNEYLKSRLKDSWEKHNVLVYPYSGARSMVSFQGEDRIHEIKKKLCNKKPCTTNLYNKMKNMNVDGLYYVRNYFMISLISMDQAQMDLLNKCL